MARSPKSKIKSKKKPAKRKTAAKGVGGKTQSVRDRIKSAAMVLAVEEGWRRVSLSRIAEDAGVTLAQLRSEFSGKAAIVNGFIADVDLEVLAGKVDRTEPARDRLFDVIMRRFDVLNPHKPAVEAIIRGTCADPQAALCTLPRFIGSMAWMLEAAGISSAGLSGKIRSRGLMAIYLNALRVWLNDDTPDMARTMAALDRGLRAAERLTEIFDPGAKPAPGEA